MKKILAILACAVIFSVLATTTVLAQAAQRGITVSGAGVVSAEPDIATVTFGVNTDSPTAREAIILNNREMTSVLAAIRAQGVSDEDISTSSFRLHQRMDWNRRAPEGYTVSNSVSVTVRDMDIIGDLMGAAVDAGANVTSNLHFAVEDSEALYREALAIAADDARAKAAALAAAMNVNITSIISITETSSWAAPLARARAGGEAFFPGAVIGEAMAFDGVGVPIEAGEISVTARVEIVFAIG